MKNTNKIGWIALGVVALPLVYALWLFDRTIYLLFFWKNHKRFADWADIDNISKSLIRLIVILSAYLIYYILF